MTLLMHDDATANLIFDGLGICCFNSQKIWEIGFLRDDNHDHDLILDIDGYPNMPRPIVDEHGVVIRISAVGATSQHTDYPKGYYGSGSIADRKKRPTSLEQAEDFGWVIDLEKPGDIDHGTGSLTKPVYPVTRAFIENAVFYTQSRPTKRLHRLLEYEDGIGLSDQEFEARMFGRTNDLIGADITCAAGGWINIEIRRAHGASTTIGPLRHRHGNPWQISLTNMRGTPVRILRPGKNPHRGHGAGMTESHGRRKGDFQLYYRAFKLVDERRRQTLWGYADTIDYKSGRTDCNMAFAGTSPNLDGLFR